MIGMDIKKIAVVGDLILDKYMFGNMNRISPEAPAPIVSLISSRYYLGGAANVANNIKAMGHEVKLFTIIGKDKYQSYATEMLEKENIPYEFSETFITTLKRRIVVQDRLIMRIDDDNFFPEEANFTLPTDVDFIIVSDYGKGTINKYTLAKIWEHAEKNSIPIIVDPCIKNMDLYGTGFLLKLNDKEWAQVDHNKALHDFEYVIVTMGDQGCIIHSSVEPDGILIPVVREYPVDPAGAGDTFCAALAIALAKGINMEEACSIANECAASVVTKVGICVPEIKV